MHERPQLLLVAVAVLWGSVGVIVREVPLPAAVIVACRAWIAAAALAVWLGLVRSGGFEVRWQRPGRVAVTGAVLALHWVLFFAALKRAPIGTVLLITYLAPVAIAALAPRLLGESVPRRVFVGLGVALAGLVLVAAPEVGAAGTGVALAAGAAALYVVIVLVAKPLSQIHGGAQLAFAQLLVAGIVLVPFAAAADWGDVRWSWAWLVPLGLVHTAAAIGVFFWALARLPATEVGVLTYLEPASAVVFGWALLSETPGVATIAGGALIVAAGIIVIRGTAVPPAPLPPPSGATAEVSDVPR